jgi:plastocyanin
MFLLVVAAVGIAVPTLVFSDPGTATVMVGAGQDTTMVSGFFPETIRVRLGDTVTWKVSTDEEFHTVTFLSGAKPPEFLLPVPGGGPGELMANPQVAFPTRHPGAPVETYGGMGYVNSGVLSKNPQAPDAPPNDTFSLTFTRVGIYDYYDFLFFPFVKGRVEVVPAGADVPTQSQIDAQAQAEMAPLLAKVEMIRDQSKMVRSEPGPGGTTIWFVKAGAVEFNTNDIRAHSFDFMPKDLTVKAGDTVIWSSPFFHTVTFITAPPPPEPIVPKPQEGGPPILALNPMVFAPAKPAAVYDPMQYFNSGPIGTLSPGGLAWALTFDVPGVYKYICALHLRMGMEGTITVLPR